MLGLDPPDHTRLRRLVAKAFTPKTVEQLRPDIVRLTDQLLDGFERGAVVDVIPELALRLPIAVISEMLGVPESYWAELQPLVRTATVTARDQRRRSSSSKPPRRRPGRSPTASRA